jgi:hypothetical protein
MRNEDESTEKMFRAATGLIPILLFTVTVFILWFALHFIWVKLTGLLICFAGGYFLIETMPGWLDLELHSSPSDVTPEKRRANEGSTHR